MAVSVAQSRTRARTRSGTDGTGGGRPHRLVIVESPAKARTISEYLRGAGDASYTVEASVGHIRDLPNGAAQVPARYKKEPWARLGVDVEHGFAPLYVINADKKTQVAKLRTLLADADELFLATDEDREGEAIAWHLREVLDPSVPVRRMVFHEITPEAIRAAISSTREIDQRLVDAQETRRVLDRLYGYEVSPVLWKKVMPRLSAGRVQSVATRLLVDRERERISFRAATYWDLEGQFDTGVAAAGPGEPTSLSARLTSVGGQRVATGRDFGPDGVLRAGGSSSPAGRSGVDTPRRLDAVVAIALREGMSRSDIGVRAVERKPYRRSPYAPFRTTTLQQEASRKLGFGAARTMQVAQRLYENGHITYMRTDSTTLSDTAIAAARRQAGELYGAAYVPDAPRVYVSKVKNAQEAHEAIRPSGDVFRTPAESGLAGDEFRLYELIWQRTVASQMADATGQSVSVRLVAPVISGPEAGADVEFSASGKVITFPGFLRAYVEGADDPDAELDDRERRLPLLVEGQRLAAVVLDAVEHSTKPPARYTEASLVRELEEREIGRPSTYASIIGTILDRGYAIKKGQALVPTFLAFAVVRLLEEHFPALVDYQFTARMEDVLDEIAGGRADMVDWLTRWYFGASGPEASNPGTRDASGREGLRTMVADLGDIDAREVNSFPVGDGIVLRVGRYGPYVERENAGGDPERANVPEGMAPDELTLEVARELLARPSGDRELGVDPVTGHRLVVKEGRYGPYVTEALDEADKAKPRTASLFASMLPETVTLEQALVLLSLPRVVGVDPATGEQITAQNGRYGPYLRKGTDSRSLPSEDSLLSIALPEALALYAQPKARGRAAAAALRELGVDPQTSRPVVVKDGRFGPYVTDGEVNVTIPRGESVEEITLERAADLLAEKRAKGPAPRRAPARAAASAKPKAGKSGAGKSGARATAATVPSRAAVRP
ncbi:MAG: type I DNA topoisomerase [Actinomycetes bacterium]